MFSFRVIKELHKARLSELVTPHGVVQGPFFQFVATNAAVRGQVYSEDMEKMGVQVVLSNTYHLHLRPGESIIHEAGGLHGFTKWHGVMTTDSGGYQVFSLSRKRKLDEAGVTFQSPIDGSRHRLTPESTVDIQRQLGADIIMPLDVCTPFDASYDEVEKAVNQTLNWVGKCKIAHVGKIVGSSVSFGADKKEQALYGIVQGGLFPDLRQRCAESLAQMGFFGYSIGGEMRDIGGNRMENGTAMTVSYLPTGAPRYLMGAGAPEDIVRAVRLGVDQFDTVLPIRSARHGRIYRNLRIEKLRSLLQEPDRPVIVDELYDVIDIEKAGRARDWQIFSEQHPVIEKDYTVAYVHHLMRTEGPSGFRLAVLHNVWFYVTLMREIRNIIKDT